MNILVKSTDTMLYSKDYEYIYSPEFYYLNILVLQAPVFVYLCGWPAVVRFVVETLRRRTNNSHVTHHSNSQSVFNSLSKYWHIPLLDFPEVQLWSKTCKEEVVTMEDQLQLQQKL